MKKAMKKTVSTLLAFAILLTGILFAPQAGTTAEAAASYYLPSSYRNMTFFCVPDDLPATYVTLKVYKKGTFQKPKASYIKNIGSSDRSVARPYIDKAGDIRVYFFKKTGTATISFQIGRQTLKSKITIKEYTSPLSKFKIGGRNFASRFASSTECNFLHENTLDSQNVSIKAAKGWRISSMKMKYGSGTFEIGSCKKTTFSKKVTFDGDADYISLTMYHAKSKAYVTLTWNCIKE